MTIADPLLDRRHQPRVGIASKQLAMSDPSPAPPFLIDEDLERVMCGALGPKPDEHSSMSASKIGSITVFAAARTTRSRTAGIESGRRSCDPPGFGMNTRRAGSGRHRSSLRSAASSSRSRLTPYRSTSAMVCRSMPATPRLARTSSASASFRARDDDPGRVRARLPHLPGDGQRTPLSARRTEQSLAETTIKHRLLPQQVDR